MHVDAKGLKLVKQVQHNLFISFITTLLTMHNRQVQKETKIIKLFRNLTFMQSSAAIFTRAGNGVALVTTHKAITQCALLVQLFVSFPQKRNGIVFSSGVNYLHSGGNIQSE